MSAQQLPLISEKKETTDERIGRILLQAMLRHKGDVAAYFNALMERAPKPSIAERWAGQKMLADKRRRQRPCDAA